MKDDNEHGMESGKIIITAEDVDGPEVPATAQPLQKPRIPLWWRLLSSLTILFPPLLLIVTIAGLIKIRRRDLAVRHAHTLHYCYLLLASGIFWMLALFALAIWTPSILLEQSTGTNTLSINAFPSVPTTNTLTGKEIAKQLSPLVVILHRADLPFFPSTKEACGAGTVAYAGQEGCLLLTSRHIVDSMSRKAGLGQLVGVTMQDGQEAYSTVVGLHRTLDLALLLVPRKEGEIDFAQPLRSFKSVEVGEQIFVIGHPEGLEFSISGGLVAQTRGDDLIQMSAPVSPGNSGGPVYDTHGRLLAVVQSVFDKTKSPNAENLNFAVRADDLLSADAWTLSNEGCLAITSLTEMNKHPFDELHLLEATK